MSKYDATKEKHATCKEQMSAAQWKKFAVQGKGPCPVCGQKA